MRARAAAVLLLVGASGLAASAAGAEPARVVTLDECTTLALAHDAGLRSTVLQSAAADARVREMQGQYVPSVSVQAGYSRLSDLAAGSLSISTPFGPATAAFPAPLLNSTTVRLSVQQPLFTGLRISGSIRQAEAARASAAGDVLRARADVRYSVQVAFWQLAKARALEEAAQDTQSQLERKLGETKTFFDQGVATSNDVLQAGSRLEDARIEAARASAARELARVQLAQLIGIPLGQPLDVPDVTGPAPDPAPSLGNGLEDLISKALAARSELASARSRITAEEAAVDVARAGRFPSLVLTGDYTLANPNARVFPQQDEFTGTWSVGIMASFDVGRYPQVAAQEQQARSRADQARETMRQLSDAVAIQVVQAAITLDSALSAYSSLQAQTAQAGDNARYVDERFRQGVVLQSAQLDAQSLLVRAQLREKAGLVDCLVARAGLDRALGE